LSQSDKNANRKHLKIARKLSNVSQIHEELRRLILRGSFEPGTRLSQIRLARQLRVGRTPLREALRMLQQEGLIVAEHNKRPRVLSFDPDSIDANSAEVILLFSLAAAVSVPRLKDEDITAMQTSLREMQVAAQREDSEGWTQADMRFHGRAFLYVGAPLDQALKRVWGQNQFYLRFLMSGENLSSAKINDEHQAILDACAARNGELASRLIARHISGGSIALLAHAMPEREPRMIRAALRLIVQKPELVVPRRATGA